MTGRNQIVITKHKDILHMLYMKDEKVYDILAGDDKSNGGPCVGDIYMGKVKNIVQNINAAFVEVKKDTPCYLSLAECGDRTIKCGDDIMVQVVKSPIKSKQAVLSVYPELAGQYCVVTTKNRTKNISRKIEDPDKRDHLKELLNEYISEEYGIVLRTNAAHASDEVIIEECHRLLEELHDITSHGKYKKSYTLLRQADPFYLSYIRGCAPCEWDRIITDIKEVHDELAGLYGDQVVYYDDPSYPLDKLLGISSKLKKATERLVWLDSGANLIIEPTEALTVIDVNTGKAVDKKRHKESTFYNINCEAAVEAARQIRIRNISGIILIDFIDMKDKSNQASLMDILRRELKQDKTKTVLVDITKLGLVEITG